LRQHFRYGLMTMNRFRLTLTAKAALMSLALAACAKGPVVTEGTPAPMAQCAGRSNAFTIPPTPATQAAMDALVAGESRDLADLFAGVGKGDSSSQIELGLRYANGTGVTQDPDRAFRLFEAAAQQGNAVGMFFLGSAYSNGLGVPTNDTQAVFIWEESARLGHPMAQYWLGFLIANGRGGIEANWCAAVPLFEAAAARDHADAAFMLGAGYEFGAFSEPDYERAAMWFRRSYEKVQNVKAVMSLRSLIDRHLVKWREGDPGKPPPPPDPKIEIQDKSVGDIG
jgi:TPR repeat protein